MDNEFEKIISEVSNGYKPTPDERENFYNSLLKHSKKTLDNTINLMESANSILSVPASESDISYAMKNYSKSVEMMTYLIDDWKAVEPYASKLFPLSIQNPELLISAKIQLYRNNTMKTKENLIRIENAISRNRKK